MNITDVRIRLMEKEGKMRAVAAITIDGDNGLFIAMPSQKRKDGEYKDIAHPIDSETRNMIQKTVIDKYNEVLREGTPAV